MREHRYKWPLPSPTNSLTPEAWSHISLSLSVLPSVMISSSKAWASVSFPMDRRKLYQDSWADLKEVKNKEWKEPTWNKSKVKDESRSTKTPELTGNQSSEKSKEVEVLHRLKNCLQINYLDWSIVSRSVPGGRILSMAELLGLTPP